MAGRIENVWRSLYAEGTGWRYSGINVLIPWRAVIDGGYLFAFAPETA